MKNISLWQLAGLTFTAVFGTLSHFLYTWTGCIALAPFCAVNESTWEHMKILFFPMLVFACIQNAFLGKKIGNFWLVKLAGIVLGVFAVPVLFYTYNGVFGSSPAWINVLIFFVAAALAYLFEAFLFSEEKPPRAVGIISLITLCAFAVFFVLFTFIPPHIPLFQDPVTGLYGIVG